jgi:uncharacterized RDD family membrane protein YckC
MSGADQYTLETPENIEVEYEPAGLGSRFCAMLIDTLLLGAILLAMWLLLLLLFPAAVPGGATKWLAAVVLAVAIALVSGGYFILFELLMRGQTPGKKAMKIRVIRDDGTPVTANEVLIRNILRLVDFLPVGYALGAIVMFPNPLAKRLGDLAAGTIVVKEGELDYRAHADTKAEMPAPTAVAANAELTAEERRLVSGFLHRRHELLPEARRQLAARLAVPLHEKYGGYYNMAETYLERLLAGRHHESSP